MSNGSPRDQMMVMASATNYFDFSYGHPGHQEIMISNTNNSIETTSRKRKPLLI